MRKKQLALTLKFWGGKRKGAGRKPKRPGRPGLPHRARAKITTTSPAHVTLKLQRGLPNLRKKNISRVVNIAIHHSAEKSAFRVAEYSIQDDHIHLIVEADTSVDLARGVQGLTVRIAKRMNNFLRRRGKVFKERYHSRILAKPREVYFCLKYVLLNARKHVAQSGRSIARNWLDPLSSAPMFDGWLGVEPEYERALPLAKCWLLSSGWQKYGLLDPNEVPGS